MGNCRVPLSLVLALQVVIVVAAFVAVIVVLSEQERTEFNDSLQKQLASDRTIAINAVAAPLLQRKEAFDQLVQLYTNGHLNDKVFAAPSDLPGADTDLSRMMPFYNQFYVMPQTDPLVQYIFMANQSLNTYPGYAVGGAQYKPGFHSTDNTKNTIWNTWSLTSQFMASVQNETVVACLGTYPIDYATCPTVSRYFASDLTFGGPQDYNVSGGKVFGAPGLQSDPSSAVGAFSHVYNYFINLDIKHQPYLVFGITFLLDNVKPYIVASISDESSKAAVFARYRHVQFSVTEYYLVGGRFDFEDYDFATFNATHEDFYKAAWRGGRTPDPILNKVFSMAEPMLPNQTGSQAFGFSYDGERYVGSMGRLTDSASHLNWLLVEYTRREEFYAPSDRARLTGILIGVFGGLLVLVTCIVIWVAIRQPLMQLREGMGLAAEMRNDEVEHIYPFLSEITDLGLAFRQMNAKLLAARPFLPQSLLQGSDSAEEEHEEMKQQSTSVIPDESSADVRQVTSPLGTNATDSTTTFNSHENGTRNSSQPSKQTSSSARKGKALVALTRDLATRRVSILTINVIGFHHGSVSGQGLQNAAGLLRLQKALARIVEVSAGEERGIVDYFHGDHFVCGFNTSRLCGNSARSGAEAATKISERFLADSELLQAFPLGLAMGLGVGKAVVGNHGTDTMQRQVTMGKVYGNSARLQEVMSRRILFGQGSTVNQHPASRCLLMGRAVQDLQTCNIHCQILGGVPADLFVPASEAHGDPKGLHSMANALNLAIMRQKVDEVQNFSDMLYAHHSMVKTPSTNGGARPSVLVACLASRWSAGNEEEWLYEMEKIFRSNPYAVTNEAIHGFWIDGSVPSTPPPTTQESTVVLPQISKWIQHVVTVLSTSENAAAAKSKLTY